MTSYKELLSGISTFVFDYDGVLTDGGVITLDDGEAYRMTNVKDGYAMQLALRKGYRVAVISGARADCMIHRLKALQIHDYFLGVGNKMETFRKYLKDHAIDPENVLFMGDDIPDYEVMMEAGLPTCPADAAEEIRHVAKYISHQGGGRGCVRDVIEQVMKIQGKWMNEDGFRW
jgi:3-deoxy-D-manno-octulosonate 8-phosphate phosphatase (KDO 8-P phosphatase)